MTHGIFDSLSDVHSAGERAYQDSALASDVDPTLRRIGRRRTVRAAGGGVATFGVLGAVAFAALTLPGRGGDLQPAATPSPSPSDVASPSPSPTPTEVVDVEHTVVNPTGMTAELLIERLAEETGTSVNEVTAAILAALPTEANGTIEGWLAPGEFTGSDADDLVEQMVDTTLATLNEAGVAPEDYQDILTVASMITQEATRDEYRKPIAQVIYNRLEVGWPLLMDAPLRYVTGNDNLILTDEDRELESPYNTFTEVGLPPTPLGSPSLADIEAAVDPGESDSMFYAVVNFDDGETRFTLAWEEYSGFLAQRDRWIEANKA